MEQGQTTATTDQRESAQVQTAGGRGFVAGVLVLCLVYLLIEIVYVTRLPMVMDEFNYARCVHQLKHQLPYRDFTPAKTVLGFYVQSLPLYLTQTPWTGLVLIKIWMAMINTAVFAIGAFLLTRHFRRGAILWSLAVLVPMSTLLERSSAVRVDMMTALFGFLSLLFLLRGRPVIAGVLCTVSFLVSQKAVYYVLAGNGALGVWLLYTRGKSLREFLLFNAAMLVTLFAYLAFWSLFAPFSKVCRDTFFQDRYYVMALEYTHPDIRKHWIQTLSRNPMFYTLAVAGLTVLTVRCWFRAAHREEWILLVYGTIVAALCLWHKQPWPYFFVLLIPTAFVIHASLFDRVLRPTPRPALRWARAAMFGLVILVGIGFPLTRLPGVIRRDSGFQREMVKLGTWLVKPGETYVDGINMLYTIPQTVEPTSWLGRLGLVRLGNMTHDELLGVVAELEAAPVKLAINSYRLPAVPKELARHFISNFGHLWGMIYIYAPRIEPEVKRFSIKFDGDYRIQGYQAPSVRIDGDEHTSGSVVRLAKGPHNNESEGAFRLHFVPEGLERIADPKYRLPQNLFVAPHDY